MSSTVEGYTSENCTQVCPWWQFWCGGSGSGGGTSDAGGSWGPGNDMLPYQQPSVSDNSSGGGGGGTASPKPQASNTITQVMQCAADFSSSHSLAAGLQAATGGLISQNNPIVNAFLGSDASTISNLITGPSRMAQLESPAISQGAVIAAKVVGNIPTATGLAGLGTATVQESAGGTAYVSSWADATVAASIFGRTVGRAFLAFSIAKAVVDAGTYITGVAVCY